MMPKTRWRISLTGLAFVTLLGVSVGPSLLFGTLESRAQGQSLLDSFDKEAEEQVRTVVETLRLTIQGRADYLAVTAGTLGAVSEWTPEDLQRIADAQLAATGAFDALYVADDSATSLVFAPSVRADGSRTEAGVSYADRLYVQELMRTHRPAYSHVQVGRQSKIANLVVAIPILHEANGTTVLKGLVAGGLHIPKVTSIVDNVLVGGRRFRAVVVDSDGSVLVDTAHRLKTLDAPQAGSAWTRACDETGMLGDGLDEHGQSIRYACGKFPLGEQVWTAYVARPHAEILQGMERARRATLRTTGLALVLALVVSALLSLRVARQMTSFRRSAERVARGQPWVPQSNDGWFVTRELETLDEVAVATLGQLRSAEDEVRLLLAEVQEANLRNEPLAAAWEQTSDAVEVLDSDGRVQFVNPAWRALMGTDDVEVMDRSSRVFQDVESLSGADALLHELARGNSWSGEVHLQVKGAPAIQWISMTPVRSESGDLRVVIVSRRDLTELRDAERKVQVNERLASIGSLAAGLAHELNNPLMYIGMNLEFIRDAVSGKTTVANEQLGGFAIDAAEGVSRVQRIVHRLMVLARSGRQQSTEPMVAVDISEVVRAAVALSRPRTAGVVAVTTSLSVGVSVSGREGELVQILLNLIANAAQALADGDSEQNRLDVSVTLDGSGVVVSVEDNGPGMDASVLQRIFDPLFTTKKAGEGTGLGLSVSQGIAAAHGGSLTATSEVGVGTRFVLRLPVLEVTASPAASDAGTGTASEEASGREAETSVQGAAPSPAEREAPRQDVQGSASASAAPARNGAATKRRVLVVDDDVMVAKSVRRMLRRQDVDVVHSGEEGLVQLEQHTYDVVVSDVRMPGLTGPKFYERARAAGYTVPFVFLTGGASDEELKTVRDTGCPVLRKPVSRKDLQSEVESAAARNDA